MLKSFAAASNDSLATRFLGCIQLLILTAYFNISRIGVSSGIQPALGYYTNTSTAN